MKEVNGLKIFTTFEDKLEYTKELIHCWYEAWDGNVYVAFSGGLGSTVLLHIIRSLYPDVKGVFNNTGLEYPEIIQHVRTFDNIVELRPKKNFKEVIDQYGWPIISKEQSQFIQQYNNAKSEKTKNTRLNGNKWGRGKISEKWKYLIDAPFNISEVCCNHLKKNPAKIFEKESGLMPFLGNMAQESAFRAQNLKIYGCNSYEKKRPSSKPLSYWTQDDLWNYIKQNDVKYSKIYDMGYTRTGCMFCMFGVHLEKFPNRFQKMQLTHPHQYDFIINKLNGGDVLDYIKVNYVNN